MVFVRPDNVTRAYIQAAVCSKQVKYHPNVTMCVQVPFQHDVVVPAQSSWIFIDYIWVFSFPAIYLSTIPMFSCVFKNMLSALCHIYLCLAWQQRAQGMVWFLCNEVSFRVTHLEKYICMCKCLKSGLRGCPNYFVVKACLPKQSRLSTFVATYMGWRKFVFGSLFLLHNVSRNLLQTGDFVGWYSLWIELIKQTQECSVPIASSVIKPCLLNHIASNDQKTPNIFPLEDSATVAALHFIH